MTVPYSAKVSTASIIGFNGLMFRFRGSVWQIIWPEFLIWSLLYTVISFVYRMLLDETWRHRFALFSLECQEATKLVPLTFILGFYVNLVLVRWSGMIESMPFVDFPAMLIATFVRPTSQSIEDIETCRMHRRTVARYMCATNVVVVRDISVGVKKRFPTFQHIVESGLLTQDEADKYEALNKRLGSPPHYIIPRWLFTQLEALHLSGMIVGNFVQQLLHDESNNFRKRLAKLKNYDWIPVPLAYTQVVVIAVRTYFLACLFGRQYLDPSKNYSPEHEIDIYIPPFTILQFIFYLGWLKVAEVLLNPYGEDDDDFEMNYMCDIMLSQSMAIVDGDADAVPKLVHDVWWDKTGADINMPYTYASQGLMNAPPVSTVGQVQLTEKEIQVVEPIVDEETSILRKRMSTIRSSEQLPTVEVAANILNNGTEQSNMETLAKFGFSMTSLMSFGSFRGTKSEIDDTSEHNV